jgi:hypothetical protein
LTTAVAMALIAGAHAATWGAYKDCPYEGFHPSRLVRTMLLATLTAFLGVTAGLFDSDSVPVTLGVIYAGERLATEWWKAIVREDDQAAYSIPMRLGYFGRPVNSPRVRYFVGFLVMLGLVTVGLIVHAAQGLLPTLPWWLVVASVGSAGGWLTACGGAWKDAPIEGFSGWKFLRSPAVATAWAVPLSALTDSWVALAMAASGVAVASIETYKTFLSGGRPPGKFATRPVRFHLPATRHWTGVVHAGAWAALAAVLGGMLASTQMSSSGGFSDGPPSGPIAAAAILVATTVMAVLVIRANIRLATIPAPAGTSDPGTGATSVPAADQ